MAVKLSDAGLGRLRALVTERRAQLPAALQPSDFLDNLIAKAFRRYPPLRNMEDEEIDEVELGDLEGGEDDAVAFLLKELTSASTSPYFPLVQQVALSGDDQAVEQLMALLDRNLRVKGILYRHGMDPDREYPGVWGKIWEAIPKWDGRDFRAYVARIIRNHCLDEIARKKKRPVSLEDDAHVDPRNPARTEPTASARDAMSFVMAVLDDLEATGRIKALDGVIFSMISNGRQVADIVHAFRTTPVTQRFTAAFELFGGRCDSSDAVLIRYLLEGLDANEIGLLTGREPSEVERVAAALGSFTDGEEQLLARQLAREGLGVSDLERAQRLTTNAINLCINRIRLKLWMALVDRAYEALRRRGTIGAVELAIVQHRCTMSPHAGCRMYKDSTCKREADASDIARKGGLDVSSKVINERMAEFRRMVVEDGLGMVFPDYNSCLIERKPQRKAAAS